jgi:predicted kinase
VSRALARELRGKVVSIDAILEDDVWDGGSEALFLRANAVAARHAEPLLRRGTPVVVDGNFYWSSALDDLARRLPYPHAVFSLEAPLDVCIARDRGRSPTYGAEAATEVYEKVARVRRGIPVDGTQELSGIVRAICAELPRALSQSARRHASASADAAVD